MHTDISQTSPSHAPDDLNSLLHDLDSLIENDTPATVKFIPHPPDKKVPNQVLTQDNHY